MISDSIQFLAGIQLVFFFPHPIVTNQNRIARVCCWKFRFDTVIAECYL